MTISIGSGISIGDLVSCHVAASGEAVVHACKDPCHKRAVGYEGNLKKDHPNYLDLQVGNDLYLNMIDPPIPLFMPKMFEVFLDFAEAQHNLARSILIHCNMGQSRAPSLALLFLAKRGRLLNNSSYQAARSEFEDRFMDYHPGAGIVTYLTEHWGEIK
jgi:predicted protein tyrosine phosphatase